MFPQRLYASFWTSKSYIILSLSFQKLLSSLLPKARFGTLQNMPLWWPCPSLDSLPCYFASLFVAMPALCRREFASGCWTPTCRQAEQWQWPICRKTFTLPAPHKNGIPDLCIKKLQLLPIVFHKGREKISYVPHQGATCVSSCGHLFSDGVCFLCHTTCGGRSAPLE